MSITFTDNTSAILVGYHNDKGAPHVETLTIPATGEYGKHTITIPATAAATQADHIVIYSASAQKTAAVWLDIDAAGTAPTGVVYTNTDYQIETNIVTGGTAIQNAALVKTAIDAEAGMTDITVTDNGDGTLTIDQDIVGWAGDFLGFNADDSGAGSISSVTDVEGLAGITQGDYVVIENAYGIPMGLWFDVDADGTTPSGAAFITAAGDGVTQMISIATGDTNVENAANVVAVLDALSWANSIQILDNEDGTIKLTHVIGGTVAAPDPHNTDDTGLGSITATVSSTGAATKLVRQDSYAKGAFSIVADTNRNVIVFNQGATNSTGYKGKESTEFKYADIAAPASTGLFDLKAQLDTMNTPGYSLALADIVVGEAAKVGEYTGTNDTFTTTSAFLADSESVVYNQVVLTRGVDYTATPSTGTIVFGFNPDPTVNAPDPTPLTFNYIKS
jgi:hypothetical protein